MSNFSNNICFCITFFISITGCGLLLYILLEQLAMELTPWIVISIALLSIVAIITFIKLSSNVCKKEPYKRRRRRRLIFIQPRNQPAQREVIVV